MFFRILLFNFAPEANVRAALHRVLYWSRSWVIGMTEECLEIILQVIEIQRLNQTFYVK